MRQINKQTIKAKMEWSNFIIIVHTFITEESDRS